MIKKSWLFLLGTILLAAALANASGQEEVKEGDTVTLHYTLTLDDGTVYITSHGKQPLHVTLGEGKLVSGFEQAVIGMRVGESKTVTVPPEEAYGQYNPELVGTVNRDLLSEGLQPEIGKQVQAQLRDGTPTLAIIIEFTETTVTLDANHPLAGLNLTFDMELLAIENPVRASLNNPANLSWIIFALGAFIIGFVLFSRKALHRSTVARRVTRKNRAFLKRAIKS